MPDLKNALASEIRRLARKEVKAAILPFHSQITALKKVITEQKTAIKALEKRLPKPSRTATTLTPVTDKAVRLSPARIIRLRQKLGLTQGQFAALLGTSNFSVSHWELGKTTPQSAYKNKIAALRGLGKRQIKQLLDQLKPASTPAPANGKAAKPVKAQVKKAKKAKPAAVVPAPAAAKSKKVKTISPTTAVTHAKAKRAPKKTAAAKAEKRPANNAVSNPVSSVTEVPKTAADPTKA